MTPKTVMRLLLLGLLLSSLLGYLEWGQGEHSFLFEAEGQMLLHGWREPAGFLNPFVILPLLGQGLLIAALLRQRQSRILILLGASLLGLLMLMVHFVALLARNPVSGLSTLPYISLAIVAIWRSRRYSY